MTTPSFRAAILADSPTLFVPFDDWQAPSDGKAYDLVSPLTAGHTFLYGAPLVPTSGAALLPNGPESPLLNFATTAFITQDGGLAGLDAAGAGGKVSIGVAFQLTDAIGIIVDRSHWRLFADVDGSLQFNVYNETFFDLLMQATTGPGAIAFGDTHYVEATFDRSVPAITLTVDGVDVDVNSTLLTTGNLPTDAASEIQLPSTTNVYVGWLSVWGGTVIDPTQRADHWAAWDANLTDDSVDMMLVSDRLFGFARPTNRSIAVGLAVSGSIAYGPRIGRVPSGTPPDPADSRGLVVLYPRGDDGTPVVTLSEARGAEWVDQLSATGSGSVDLDNDDPDLLLVEAGQMARIFIDGDNVFSFLVETHDTTTISPNEETDEFTQIAGRGRLAVVERGVIAPSWGDQIAPIMVDRTFDWTSVEFDDSTWTQPGYLDAFSTLRSVYPDKWGMAGHNLPGSTAYVFVGPGQSTDPGAVSFVPGLWLYRGRVAIPETGPYMVVLLQFGTSFNFAGSIVNFAIDGIPISPTPPGGNGDVFDTQARIGNAAAYRVEMTKGTHLFAVQDELLTGPAPDLIVSGAPMFCMSIFRLDYANVPIYTPEGLAYETSPASVGDWLSAKTDIPNPFGRGEVAFNFNSYPTMRIGYLLRVLFQECQARGCLLDLTWDFGDDVDSAGEPWTVFPALMPVSHSDDLQVAYAYPDVTTKVGYNLLTFLTELAGTYVDVRMAPGANHLSVFNKGGMGRATGFALHQPTDPADPDTANLTELHHVGFE